MPRKNASPTDKTGLAQRILSLLEDAGDWHSGEELARRLNVSRMTVAKHVAALRGAGHIIQARTHKGYLLEIKAEPFREASTNPWLKTRILGRAGWREFSETGSTNNEAIAWALSGAPSGAVVAAETQTDGKGRRGHDWFSSSRGLSASVVLRPAGRELSGDAVTRHALESMRQAILEIVDVETDCKAPNDLYLGGKKICGILAETGWRGDEQDWLVLGVGCNVAVLPEEFPGAIADRVTSLYASTGAVVSKNRLFAGFLNHFEKALRL